MVIAVNHRPPPIPPSFHSHSLATNLVSSLRQDEWSIASEEEDQERECVGVVLEGWIHCEQCRLIQDKLPSRRCRHCCRPRLYIVIVIHASSPLSMLPIFSPVPHIDLTVNSSLPSSPYKCTWEVLYRRHPCHWGNTVLTLVASVHKLHKHRLTYASSNFASLSLLSFSDAIL